MIVISVIKDGAAIDTILAHLQYKFDPLSLSVRPPPDTPTEWDPHFHLNSFVDAVLAAIRTSAYSDHRARRIPGPVGLRTASVVGHIHIIDRIFV